MTDIVNPSITDSVTDAVTEAGAPAPAPAATRDELFRLHLAQHTNQVTSTAALLGKRREIARILTILRARELGTETQGQKTQTRRAKSSKTPQAKS